MVRAEGARLMAPTSALSACRRRAAGRRVWLAQGEAEINRIGQRLRAAGRL